MDITISEMKKHWRGLVLLVVFLSLFTWLVVECGGPLTVDDVPVWDVEDYGEFEQ